MKIQYLSLILLCTAAHASFQIDEVAQLPQGTTTVRFQPGEMIVSQAHVMRLNNGREYTLTSPLHQIPSGVFGANSTGTLILGYTSRVYEPESRQFRSPIEHFFWVRNGDQITTRRVQLSSPHPFIIHPNGISEDGFHLFGEYRATRGGPVSFTLRPTQ
jgi:hypothetical protein